MASQELLGILRFLGTENINLRKRLIALEGLLIEKGVLTAEELRGFRQTAETEYFGAARQAGTSALQELEDLLRRLQKKDA